MNIARNLLVRGLAGLVVIAGVGSLITFGIMAGVKVAYAADSHPGMTNGESAHSVVILDNNRNTEILDRVSIEI